MIEEKRIMLTTEQAVTMLADGDDVHTFRGGGMVILGADWGRAELIKAIEENECEIGGESCRGMNHGLVVWVDGSPLYVECKEGIDYEDYATEANDA